MMMTTMEGVFLLVSLARGMVQMMPGIFGILLILTVLAAAEAILDMGANTGVNTLIPAAEIQLSAKGQVHM